MATKRYNKVLGIALGDRSAMVAEVAAGAGRPRLTRAAEFPFPEGLRLEQAELLGRALGAFLRAQGFGTRAAVFGVPARWLLAKKKQVPPVDAATAAGILRLQAESEFSAEAEELVCDFDGAASEAGARDVLLLALPRRYAAQVTALAATARVQAVSLTPYGTALAAALAGANGDATAVLLGPGGAELVALQGGQPRLLRYVGSAAAPASTLAAEVRRASVGMPGLLHGPVSSGAGRGTNDLWLWNDAGVDAQALSSLGEALRRPLRGGEFPALGVESMNGTAVAGGRGFAAAVSLALAGLDGTESRPWADFLHPRLAPPRPSRLPRRPVMLALTGLAVVLLVALIVVDLRGRQREVFDLRHQVAQNAENVKAAESFLGRVTYAKGWGRGKPRFIACLREVTAAVPEDGRTYLTSFNLGDDMQGGFTGKSSGANDVLALRDRLRDSGRFRDVRLSWDAPRATARPGGPGPGQPPGAGPAGVPGAPSPGAPPPGMPPPSGGPPGPSPGGAPQVMPGPQPMPTAVASAAPMPGAGVLPPGVQPGAPPAAAQAPARPAPPAGASPPAGAQPPPGPGAQPAQGEVAFTVTFHYVPPG